MSGNALYEQEQNLVRGQLWRLSPEAQDRWTACKSSHRFMAYKNKKLVVYSLFDGQPSVEQILTCTAASFSLGEGLTSSWLRQIGDDTGIITVGHLPQEIVPSVFLWHTYLSDIQYIPYKHVYSAKFPLVYKSRHHPRLRHSGFSYIQEISAFQGEFNASL